MTRIGSGSRRTAALAALVAVFTTACASGGPGDAGTAPDVVRVSTGALHGVLDGSVRRFHAVPYAAAPVGDLRLAPPAAPASWSGERDATRPGPACLQAPGTPGAPATGQEDCLTVDVTTPATPSPRPRPVLVWLHGGGLSAGSGNELDPVRMVTRGDAIVVTVEFRLGALGFLGDPAFGPQSGTLGFADQQAALRWVHDEIPAFGGDPGQVVLAGESGGSIGACAQLVSPSARGLFRGAILQSGSCDTTTPPVALPGLPPIRYIDAAVDTRARAQAVARRLGCADPGTVAACLRALPAERIATEGADVVSATWGGPLLPVDPARALRDPAAIADVPVLSGNNRDEGTVFAQTFDLLGQPITDATLTDRLRAAFGPQRAAAVEREYPSDSYRDAGHRFAAVAGDAFFACPQATLAANLSRRAAPVYGYEFADRTSPGYVPILDSYRDVGASHASELPYLFDFRDKPISFTGRARPLTAAQRALGDRMIDHWARFVHLGDPGWPRVDAGGPGPVTAFAAPQPPGVDPVAEHHCAFWAPAGQPSGPVR